MHKEFKIAVYAICKNEEKFVDRWINSLREADHIFVLDTGSTDTTVEKLQKYNDFVTVQQKEIVPWHFGNARNAALSMVTKDYDICVVADLDHIFRPGWAKVIKDAFKNGNKEVYGPIIDYDDNNREIKRFLSKNVHLNDYHWWWERPIHEGLIFHPDDNLLTFESCNLPDFVIEHHPDRNKSRGSYLTLLENEYKENSKDPLCAIYYGCELSFHGKDDDANDVFLKALDECDFTDNIPIKYMICLNIASYYHDNKDYENMRKYLAKATDTKIYTKKLQMGWAEYYYQTGDYKKAIYCTFDAIDEPLCDNWMEDDYFNRGGCYVSIVNFLYAEAERYHYNGIDKITTELALIAYASLAEDCNTIDVSACSLLKEKTIDHILSLSDMG